MLELALERIAHYDKVHQRHEYARDYDKRVAHEPFEVPFGYRQRSHILAPGMRLGAPAPIKKFTFWVSASLIVFPV